MRLLPLIRTIGLQYNTEEWHAVQCRLGACHRVAR